MLPGPPGEEKAARSCSCCGTPSARASELPSKRVGPHVTGPHVTGLVAPVQVESASGRGPWESHPLPPDRAVGPVGHPE